MAVRERSLGWSIQRMLPEWLGGWGRGKRQPILPRPDLDPGKKKDHETTVAKSLEQMLFERGCDFTARKLITEAVAGRSDKLPIEEWATTVAANWESSGFLVKSVSRHQLGSTLEVLVRKPNEEAVQGLIESLNQKRIGKEYQRLTRITSRPETIQSVRKVERVGPIANGRSENKEPIGESHAAASTSKRMFLEAKNSSKPLPGGEAGRRMLEETIRSKFKKKRDLQIRMIAALDRLSKGWSLDLVRGSGDQIKGDGQWDGYMAIHFTPYSALILFRFEGDELHVVIGDHQDLYLDHRKK